MTPYSFPERDWKVYRDLNKVFLNRFCQRILDELVQISQDSGSTPHERYLKVHQHIQKKDRLIAQNFDHVARSSGLDNLCGMRRLGLITEEEFERLTPETRSWIDRILKG